jgi:hypothetical protein
VSREVCCKSCIWLPSVATLLMAFAPGAECLGQTAAPPSAVKEIQLSFKRDPRMVDPYRGIKPWVTGSNYNGATAQDTVEARAEGINAAGKRTKISAEWSASDPEMVTVSPAQGDDVNITVHRAGESKLRIVYQGLSKELVIRAKYVGKFMLFEIGPLAPATAHGSATTAIDPSLKTEKEQVSYAAGMNLAMTLQRQSVEVDEKLVEEGFRDVFSGRRPLMSEEQAHAALTRNSWPRTRRRKES